MAGKQKYSRYTVAIQSFFRQKNYFHFLIFIAFMAFFMFNLDNFDTDQIS